MKNNFIDERTLPVQRIIYARKSTRSFSSSEMISRENLEIIIRSGFRAPSPKNRQPWQYYVVESISQKQRIAGILRDSLERLRVERMNKGKDYSDLLMAEQSARILEEASILVFVCYERDPSNEHGEVIRWELSAQAFEVGDLQAIGASVQNMLLQATELGIDSLWIGDVLYAHDELREFLHLQFPFLAVIALGRATPYQTVRKDIDDKVIWDKE